MTHTLVLSHDKVFEKAELLTSYQAAKDGTDFDRDRIKKADREYVDSCYDEAVGILTQLLLKYIVAPKEECCDCAEIDMKDWTVILDLHNFPLTLTKSLDSLAYEIAASYAVSKWMTMLVSKQQVTSSESASLYTMIHQDYIEKFKHLLNTRVRPIRLKQRPF